MKFFTLSGNPTFSLSFSMAYVLFLSSSLLSVHLSCVCFQVYSAIDMGDFEKTFSAYQHKDPSTNGLGGGAGERGSGSSDTPRRSRPPSVYGERPKELSLIEGRRAQNLNILLSRNKLTEDDIQKMMMDMDPRERLDKNTVEQLLKYVPTLPEKELLESHVHEMPNFARADRFMFITSRYWICY